MKNQKLYLTLGAVGVLLVAVVAVVAYNRQGSNLSGYLNLQSSTPTRSSSSNPLPPVSNVSPSTALKPLPPVTNVAPSTALAPVAPISNTPGVSYKPDTTAPTVSIYAPTDGQTIHGNSILVMAYAKDNIGVTKVEFRSGLGYVLLPAGTLTKPDPQTNAYKYTLNIANAPDGLQIFSVWAYDAAGNVGKKTISFTLDNTGPNLSVNIPDNKSLYAQCMALYDSCEGFSGNGIMKQGKSDYDLTLNLSVDALDPSGVNKVTYSIDNHEIETSNTAPYSFSKVVASDDSERYKDANGHWHYHYIISQGLHFLNIDAWDKLGNKSSKTVKFTVDEFFVQEQPMGLTGYEPYIKDIQITN